METVLISNLAHLCLFFFCMFAYNDASIFGKFYRRCSFLDCPRVAIFRIINLWNVWYLIYWLTTVDDNCPILLILCQDMDSEMVQCFFSLVLIGYSLKSVYKKRTSYKNIDWCKITVWPVYKNVILKMTKMSADVSFLRVHYSRK